MRTLTILLVLSFPVLAAPETPDLSAEIKASEMSAHVRVLASDDYEGRLPLPDTPGGAVAIG